MKRKTLRKHPFALFFALCFVWEANAQAGYDTLPYTSLADFRIQYLNKAEITSGILYDRSYPVANVDRFKTQLNTLDTSGPRHFLQAYYELYNAAYNTAGWLSPDDLDKSLDSASRANNVPIGLLHYNYDVMDSNAYTDRLIDTLSNGQFTDVAGRPRSPYLNLTTFIASPLLSENAVFEEGQEYTFYLDPRYFLYNQNLNIQEIRIDFGDGQGEWVVSNPFGGGSSRMDQRTTSSANFITKIIGRTMLGRITIVAIDILGHWIQYGNPFTIFAKKKPADPGLSSCKGLGQNWVIDADPAALSVINNQYGNPKPQPENLQKVQLGPLPFQFIEVPVKDTAYFFFKEGTCPKPVRRPVIFIDGFDPTNDRGVAEIYRDYINRGVTRNGIPKLFGDYMLDNGNGLDDDFDFIVLDFKHGNDLIERNALTLVALIQRLNQTYGNDYLQNIVLIGPSMGSLIAQYALAYMEHNGIPHRVKTYISFDGCHQGANVPIGIQNFVEYVTKRGILKGIKTVREGLYNGLAARQMLAHHQSANSQFPAPDALRVQFLQNLAAVGEYPQQCRKVAIINGANTGVRNPKHYPNDELLGIQIKRGGLAGLCGDNICKKIKWKARSATDNGTNQVAEMWTASPFYNTLFWVPFGAKTYYADAAWGNSSLDDAPGGLFGEKVSDDYKTHGTFFANELIYLITGDRTNFNININNFTMMPSYNSADLRFPSKNLYMKWDDQDLCGKTPFDYVYAPSENQEHVAISQENSYWFENEARCDVNTLPVLVSPIVGRDNVCSSEVFSISSCKPINSVQWNITPSGIATISGSGTQITVNKQSDGVATLEANITFCNSTLKLTKQIQTGLKTPSFTVNALDYCEGTSFDAVAVPNNPGQTLTYNWFLNGSPESYTGHKLRDNFPSDNNYIELSVTSTTCGTSDIYYNTFTCSNGFTFSLAPNPSSDAVQIESKSTIRRLRVIDKMGNVKKTFQYAAGTKKLQLSLADLTPDVYTIQAFDGQNWYSKKMVKN